LKLELQLALGLVIGRKCTFILLVHAVCVPTCYLCVCMDELSSGKMVENRKRSAAVLQVSDVYRIAQSSPI
jgi:hypothetical protein